jgi:hypothetical protein
VADDEAQRPRGAAAIDAEESLMRHLSAHRRAGFRS